MHWRKKAALQRFCATLPAAGDALYYALQRVAGGLRHPPNPIPWLRAALEIATDLQVAGVNPEGARIVEIGTGRGLEMPAGFYLLGASRIDTYDLYRILAEWRVQGLTRQLAVGAEEIASLLGPLVNGGSQKIFERISRLTANQPDTEELMRRMGVIYHAPADAAHTGLPDASVDAHVSFTVFEHIPATVLSEILREASRILAPGGAAVHHVDLSDHFAHDDSSITAVNFLQYTKEEWDRLAGNRFAYHNRLRVEEMHAVFSGAGHRIEKHTDWTDAAGLAALQDGLPLAPEFAGQSLERLALTGTRVVSRPQMARTPASNSAK